MKILQGLAIPQVNISLAKLPRSSLSTIHFVNPQTGLGNSTKDSTKQDWATQLKTQVWEDDLKTTKLSILLWGKKECLGSYSLLKAHKNYRCLSHVIRTTFLLSAKGTQKLQVSLPCYQNNFLLSLSPCSPRKSPSWG
jgi:hypothetical protein